MKFSKFFSLALLFSLSLALSGCFEKKEEEETLPSTDSGGGGGSGGGGSGGVASMTTQGNYRIIFVTSTSVNGSGSTSGTGSGLASFDALCELEKQSKGFGGTFKAMIGVGQRKPSGSDWIFRAGKEYRREDLTTVIGTPYMDATQGINGLILPFQTGTSNTITASGTNYYPWTGFKNNWELDTYNCTNWSRSDYDGTQDTFGTYGKSSIDANDDEYVDLGFTQFWGGPLFYNADSSGEELKCTSLHPIYCVQTKQLPPPGDYKKLFMSLTGVRGDAGIPAMDARCAADALTKGLSGTYKAVVVGRENPSGGGTAVLRRVCEAGDCAGATGMEQAVDWVLYPNTMYRRDDNVTYIGTTNEHGYFEGELEEPIATGGSYWSGMTNAVALSATFQHCGGWSEPTFNGWTNEAGAGTAAYGSSQVLCSNALSVLCAEQ